MDQNKSIGSTTIAPDVITTIARLTSLATPGVSRMSPVPGTCSKKEEEGVRVRLQDAHLFIDIYLIINGGENVLLVSESVQNRVRRAITEMVGMEVAQIDVYVTDVDIEA